MVTRQRKKIDFNYCLYLAIENYMVTYKNNAHRPDVVLLLLLLIVPASGASQQHLIVLLIVLDFFTLVHRQWLAMYRVIGKYYAARVHPFLLILLLKMPGRIKLKNNLSVCFGCLDGSDTQAWWSVTSHAHRSSSPAGGSV